MLVSQVKIVSDVILTDLVLKSFDWLAKMMQQYLDRFKNKDRIKRIKLNKMNIMSDN